MIADLHCDLLCYLQKDPKRTANDLQARCSLPQLRRGGVRLQTMAIFTETHPGSSFDGDVQARIFANLPRLYPGGFKIVDDMEELQRHNHEGPIGILLGIENASSLFEENESMEEGFKRFRRIRKACRKIVYISLTWNMENRFGGGALSKAGLKKDGRLLLDFLHDKKIAVDFSHASDALAYDILDYIEKKSHSIPVLASHSNFRTAFDTPRNLPDAIAREIIARKGVIGINFIRQFLGENPQRSFLEQLEHALSLGAEKSLCFGADFFYPEDVSAENRKPDEVLFFPELGNASVYCKVLDYWKMQANVASDILERIACRNLTEFLVQSIL